MNTLKIEISSWNGQLKSYSSFRAKGETATDFDFPLSFDDVSGIFKQRTTPNPIALLIGFGLYLLMMLSYFITKRDTRSPLRGNFIKGLKLIFRVGSVRENEL